MHALSTAFSYSTERWASIWLGIFGHTRHQMQDTNIFKAYSKIPAATFTHCFWHMLLELKEDYLANFFGGDLACVLLSLQLLMTTQQKLNGYSGRVIWPTTNGATASLLNHNRFGMSWSNTLQDSIRVILSLPCMATKIFHHCTVGNLGTKPGLNFSKHVIWNWRPIVVK